MTTNFQINGTDIDSIFELTGANTELSFETWQFAVGSLPFGVLGPNEHITNGKMNFSPTNPTLTNRFIALAYGSGANAIYRNKFFVRSTDFETVDIVDLFAAAGTLPAPAWNGSETDEVFRGSNLQVNVGSESGTLTNDLALLIATDQLPAGNVSFTIVSSSDILVDTAADLGTPTLNGTVVEISYQGLAFEIIPPSQVGATAESITSVTVFGTRAGKNTPNMTFNFRYKITATFS